MVVKRIFCIRGSGERAGLCWHAIAKGKRACLSCRAFARLQEDSDNEHTYYYCVTRGFKDHALRIESVDTAAEQNAICLASGDSSD